MIKDFLVQFGLAFVYVSTAVYILTLPVFSVKFHLIDGVNALGYISPVDVLVFECVLCTGLCVVNAWFFLGCLRKMWRFLLDA